MSSVCKNHKVMSPTQNCLNYGLDYFSLRLSLVLVLIFYFLEISNGNVLLQNNSALCFYNINWHDLLLSPETQSLREVYNSTKCK